MAVPARGKSAGDGRKGTDIQMRFVSLLTSSTAPSGAAGFFQQYGMIILIVVMVVLLYFVMIRPQRKQEKETREMRNNLAIGDEIVTIGGIVGIIISISGEDTVTIVSSRDRTRLQILRSSVSRVQVHAGGGQQAQSSDQKDAGDKKDNSDKKKNAAGDESKPADKPENEKK